MSRPWFEPCSVWATVVCPDSHLDRVRAWVADRCVEWGVAELHAGRSTQETRALWPNERHEVCAFVATGDLLWDATLVDSLMLSAADVAARQANQLKQFRKDWARSKRGESTRPADFALGRLTEELLDPSSGVKAAPFTQYAAIAPRHVRETVQSIIRVYHEPRWRDEFCALRTTFDRKNEPQRPADTPGEILFFNVVMPILASPQMALSLPPAFQDPTHPLHACHGATQRGGIDIASLLDGGVRFVDSEQDPLIQLADVLAYVMRRAATKPQDEAAARSYAIARRRLFQRTPVMFSSEGFARFERYHHVLR